MKLIDLWYEELRRRGITQKVLDRRAPVADRAHPWGAKMMRTEITEKEIPMFRKFFATSQMAWWQYSTERRGEYISFPSAFGISTPLCKSSD
jgi:hypothetical protein